MCEKIQVDNQTDITRRQQDDQYDEEVDKLIIWLQHIPHLPNITGNIILFLNQIFSTTLFYISHLYRHNILLSL